MSQSAIPTAGIRAAFDRAAQAHQVAQAHRTTQTGPELVATTAATRAATPVEQAIANAAQRTSVDFGYLVAQAQVESAMNPTAKARTSSATGLYQFIDSTWLGTMQRHGGRFGLADFASQIDTRSNGTAYVANPEARQAILDLRNNPQIASLMAAGLAEDNRAHLTPILGRQPDHSELYLAHFLGAGGAGRFLTQMAKDPSQSAASLFRGPAAANRPVFYEPNGTARSLGGVMEFLSGKLENARAKSSAQMPAGSADPFAPANLAMTPIGAQSRTTFSTAPGSLPRMPLASSSAGFAPARAPMSTVLQGAFNVADGVPGRGGEHIRKAYQQLKAIGL